ncbi:MAG TPA: TOBE domain-containing protein [Oxalicibacterium sp.]|nr:TOBE domain-containing protein [Oxalicibacterium sp.]
MSVMKKSEAPVKLEGLSKSRGKRWDHLELLERIDASGSISAAATAMGMSYKAAWQAVEAINNLSREPLVVRQPGGSSGGGTSLTEYGRRMVATYRRLEQEWASVPAAVSRMMDDFDQYYRMSRRFDMQTSARNQFLGTVKSVQRGAVNAEVILDIGSGSELAAIITNDSAEHLALEKGSEAYALVKAQWIVLAVDQHIKTSARNCLSGTVVRRQEGAVNAEVVIELPGGKTVAAIITNESVKTLGLKEGMRASALIKASHIILAVPA